LLFYSDFDSNFVLYLVSNRAIFKPSEEFESKTCRSGQTFHLKELGGLELLKAQYHHKQFSKHVHEGYCIGVIEDGAQSFYRTGQLHTAPKGDIILVNADEIHTGSSAVESGWKYRAIYPTPEMLLDAGQDFLVSKIVCLGFLMLLFTMLVWHSSFLTV
jgi:hypothetical protein